MSQINSNTKDDFQVVFLLSCFVGHPVQILLNISEYFVKCIITQPRRIFPRKFSRIFLTLFGDFLSLAGRKELLMLCKQFVGFVGVVFTVIIFIFILSPWASYFLISFIVIL